MAKAWLFTLFILFGGFLNLYGQMLEGSSVFYGNEWIDYTNNYFKIQVAEDRIYRITKDVLLAAGVPANSIPGDQYHIYHLGKRVPIYVSSNNVFQEDDYIEFFGKKNRGQIDKYLFKEGSKEILNPNYSLVNDTSAYFLSWDDTDQAFDRISAIQNDLNGMGEKEAWYWHDERIDYNQDLIKNENAQGVKRSQYTLGEGYGSSMETEHEITIQSQNAYLGLMDSAKLVISLSLNNRDHLMTLSINKEAKVVEDFYGFAHNKYEFSLQLTQPNENIKIHTSGTGGKNDRQSVGFVQLTYPRQFNFNDATLFAFSTRASTNNQYLEIERFSFGNEAPILYDLTNQIRISGITEGGKVLFKLPPSIGERNLFLTSANEIQAIAALKPTNFVNYAQQEGEFIIISNQALIGEQESLGAIQQYADYRSSLEGGSFSTTIIDIQQLYDQFAYGVDRHFIAIRNFGHFIHQTWQNPKYILILGKGIESNNIRSPEQVQAHTNRVFFVPTYGNPGSDNLLLGNNFSSTPIIPIGRIAAVSQNEVEIYLKKVKSFEAANSLPQTIEDKFWMKKVLHLGGGDPAIQRTIRRNLEYLETIIEGGKFGADVTGFYKESTDAIQVSTSDELFKLINNGLAIITFYGHSGANSFDFTIDEPANYENVDKYPVFISLGCYSGQIHNDFKGISEKFVLTPDRGSIAFLASTGLGYVSALRLAGGNFYQALSEGFYGRGIGDIMQATLARMDSMGSIGIEELSNQFTLHGDPAVVLNAHPGPDYTIDASSISFEPKVIDIQKDTFILKFDLINLGYHQLDSIPITIRQELPNGSIGNELIVKTSSVASRKEVQMKLPNLGKPSVGLNTFYLTIDETNELEERPTPYAESNNELTLNTGEKGIKAFILDNNINPIYPKDCGIVYEQPFRLVASTTNSLAPQQDYIFELDTTEAFNSPLKIVHEVAQIGGVASWSPDITLEDQRVYYWRISADSTNEKVGYDWKTSSFTFVEDGTSGWSQSQYAQYLNDTLIGLQVSPGNQFSFTPQFFPFEIRNRVYSQSDPPKGLVNGTSWSDFFRWELPGSLTFVVFDKQGQIWFNFRPGEYGSTNRRAARIGAYPFKTDSYADRLKVINFIEEVIPEDALVFAYTALRNEDIDLSINDWQLDSIQNNGKNIFNVLEQYGAKYIRDLQKEMVPYVIVFQKNSGTETEIIGSSISDFIQAEQQIKELKSEGSILSKLIGPSTNWRKLYFNNSPSIPTETDSIHLQLWGISKPGSPKALLWTYSELEDEEIDLSFVDADLYPYLQLELNSMDPVDKSAPQLDLWRVTFDGVPELAVNPARHYVVSQDTLDQGNAFNIEVAIDNVSPIGTDSLLLKYVLTTSQNVQNTKLSRVAPVDKNGSQIVHFNASTEGFLNQQNFLLEVNPDNDQPELFHFNNFLQTNFEIRADDKSPILDVTFDGLHIMDGDLVSSEPLIQASLIDENEFLEIGDTSNFRLFLKFPNGDIEQIDFSKPNVSTEIKPNEKRVDIFISPVFLESGQYELLANVKDVSNNLAGVYDYRVVFKVITENSISNVFNYPNPFSTSTQFVYTLTGKSTPFNFKVQIFTVSGRLVREIQQEEIGDLKIGTHRTTYAWDGTDEYGDRLANGVYLYKIIAKDEEGKAYKSFENGTDQYFRNGFGKMVILR